MPKKLRVKSSKVKIYQRGDEFALRKKAEPSVQAFELLGGLPDDIKLSRRQKDKPQKRRRL
ncbi:MAG: hypothetical protein WCA00_15470 [Candidatus Acidiferrales bacterium]